MDRAQDSRPVIGKRRVQSQHWQIQQRGRVRRQLLHHESRREKRRRSQITRRRSRRHREEIDSAGSPAVARTLALQPPLKGFHQDLLSEAALPILLKLTLARAPTLARLSKGSRARA